MTKASSMFVLLFLTFCLFSFQAVVEASEAQSTEGWQPIDSTNSSFLLLKSRKMSAKKATDYCRARRAHLMLFFTKSELSQLKHFFSSLRSLPLTGKKLRNFTFWTDGYWDSERENFLWFEEQSSKKATLLQDLTSDLDIPMENSATCVSLVVDKHGKFSMALDSCHVKKSFVCEKRGKKSIQVDVKKADTKLVNPSVNQDRLYEESDFYPVSNDEFLHFDLKESDNAASNATKNQSANQLKSIDQQPTSSTGSTFVRTTQYSNVINITREHDLVVAKAKLFFSFFSVDLSSDFLLIAMLIIAMSFIAMTFTLVTLTFYFKHKRVRRITRFRKPCSKNAAFEEGVNLTADWA